MPNASSPVDSPDGEAGDEHFAIEEAIALLVERLEPPIAGFVRESQQIRGPLPKDQRELLIDLALEDGSHRAEIRVLVALARLEERARSLEYRVHSLETAKEESRVALSSVHSELHAALDGLKTLVNESRADLDKRLTVVDHQVSAQASQDQRDAVREGIRLSRRQVSWAIVGVILAVALFVAGRVLDDDGKPQSGNETSSTLTTQRPSTP